jgi:hypothetical protein
VGIFDRLETVIKSYLNPEDERIFGRSRRGDPDLEEAEAELERFLRGGGSGNRKGGGEAWSDGTGKSGVWGDGRTGGGAWTDGRADDRTTGRADGRAAGGATGGAWDESRTAGGAWGDGARQNRGAGLPPEELRSDFAELGLPFGAGEEECKAAYKRLLKLHHPDRHAGHERNMKKATEKTMRINAAYDRIEKWRTEKSARP